MARYTVQAPDGNTYDIEGPDGASTEQVIAKAQELAAAESGVGQFAKETAASSVSTAGEFEKIARASLPMAGAIPQKVWDTIDEYTGANRVKQWAEDASTPAYRGSFSGRVAGLVGAAPLFVALGPSRALQGAAGAGLGYEQGQTELEDWKKNHPGEELSLTSRVAVPAQRALFGAATGVLLGGRGLSRPVEALAKKLPSVPEKAIAAGVNAGALAGIGASGQLASNITAQETYNPQQKTWEGVAEAAGPGAVVGGLLGGALHQNTRESKTPSLDALVAQREKELAEQAKDPTVRPPKEDNIIFYRQMAEQATDPGQRKFFIERSKQEEELLRNLQTQKALEDSKQQAKDAGRPEVVSEIEKQQEQLQRKATSLIKRRPEVIAAEQEKKVANAEKGQTGKKKSLLAPSEKVGPKAPSHGPVEAPAEGEISSDKMLQNELEQRRIEEVKAKIAAQTPQKATGKVPVGENTSVTMGLNRTSPPIPSSDKPLTTPIEDELKANSAVSLGKPQGGGRDESPVPPEQPPIEADNQSLSRDSEQRPLLRVSPLERIKIGEDLVDADHHAALDYVAKKSPNPVHRFIAKRVAALVKGMENNGWKFEFNIHQKGDLGVPDAFYENKGMRGRTSVTMENGVPTARVHIAGNTFPAPGTAFRTILHEFVHAVTMSVTGSVDIPGIHVTRVGKALKDLQKLHTHVVAELGKKDPMILSQFEKDLRAGNTNTLKNIDELLAWGLTDGDAQTFLDSVHYKTKKGFITTAWDELRNVVRETLGFPHKYDTALDELLRISETVLSPHDEAFVNSVTNYGWPHTTGQHIANMEDSRGAGKAWLEDDAKPIAKEASRQFNGLGDGLLRMFAPHTRSEDAAKLGRAIREGGSTEARANDQARLAMEEIEKLSLKMGPHKSLIFMDNMEKGLKQATPELDAVSRKIKILMDSVFEEAQKLGADKIDGFVQYYFPHIWKNPTQAYEAFNAALRNSKLEGSKRFMSARVVPYIMDGIKGIDVGNGRVIKLEPVSYNFAHLVLLKIQEMNKFIKGQKLINELIDKGLVKRYKEGDIIPFGHRMLDTTISRIFLPDELNIEKTSTYQPGKEIQKAGYYIPDEMAQVFDNYLKPGLRTKPGVKALMWLGNTLNQVQLGLSAFHLGFTCLDAASSKTAVGLMYISEGKLAKGASMVAQGMHPLSWATVGLANLSPNSFASKMIAEWNHPGSQGAEVAQMVENLRIAGGRPTMDKFYNTNMYERMMTAWHSGNIIGFTARVPFGLIDLAAKPVMQYIVPRQKMAVFADMARFEMERLPPGSDKDTVRKALQKAWDSVDNRMGQVVYDNYFWNKMAKDLAFLSVRSLGWNAGTIREIGGGALDAAKFAIDTVKGVPGERPVKGKDGVWIPEKVHKGQFTHRMAYVMGAATTIGILGGVIHYMRTGERPKELIDYYFSKAGENDINGRELRLSLPSYAKDFFQVAHNPWTTIGHKLNPIIGLMFDAYNNKDFYGTEIVHPGDDWQKEGEEILKFIGTQLTPFGIRNFEQLSKTTDSNFVKYAGFVGLTKAPSWLEETKAQQVASDIILSSLPTKGRTAEQYESSQIAKQVVAGLRSTDNAQRTKSIALGNQALRDGRITPRQWENIHVQARTDPLVWEIRNMTGEQVLKVWEVTTAEEKKRIRPFVIDKVMSDSHITPEQKKAYAQEFKQ